jgi:pimeloyl-ACP methyl ester carboxylesterase
VETVLMAGVGHFLMLEDPAGFNCLLSDVVGGFGGAEPTGG